MKFDFSIVKERKGYGVLLGLIKVIAYAVYDLDYIGKENIPKRGGFVLAANHISFSDPAVIMAGCPRQCHFMAKNDLLDIPVFGRLLAYMNAFPVKRGMSDVSAVSYAKRVVQSGFVLGIFPEGRRNKNTSPQSGKSGAAYIVKTTGADVLPVSIYRKPGGRRLRPRLTVRFGPLIPFSQFGFGEQYRKEEIRAAAERIMREITELWEKEHEKS